jgi:hypothetical protein
MACTQAIPLPVGNSAARIVLPDTIRLLRRGIVGDRYVMESSTRTIFAMSFQKDGENEDTNVDTTETKTETLRVRAGGADGTLTVEERPGETKKTIIKDGEREVVASQPDGWLAIYKANGERVSHTRLPNPPKKETQDTDTDATEDRPPAKPDSDEQRIDDPPFPDRTLHVGNTWTGTIPMLSKEICGDPAVNYTAKLTAIELHKNVPCARVEYTLSATNTKLPPVISKQLAFEATGKGTLKMTGTVTGYYTLDRGAVLDSESKIAITMKFDLTEPDPNSENDLHRVVKVTIRTNGIGTASQFPTYNLALVPDASAVK